MKMSEPRELRHDKQIRSLKGRNSKNLEKERVACYLNVALVSLNVGILTGVTSAKR